MSKNKITYKGLHLLKDHLLSECKDATEIVLSGNKLGDESIPILVEMIKRYPKLQVIEIGGNDISDAGLEQFPVDIASKSQLKSLSFAGNKNISNSSIPTLVELIQNSKIENVNLKGTSITICTTISGSFIKSIFNGKDKIEFWQKYV